MSIVYNLIIKYKYLISYLVFGVLTTCVNIGVYHLLYSICGISNVFSASVACVIAVSFAFITNKLYVFGSKIFTREVWVREAIAFFLCRFITGVIDVVIMYVAVDIMEWHALLWKCISNVTVIVLNFFASKFLVFKQSV